MPTRCQAAACACTHQKGLAQRAISSLRALRVDLEVRVEVGMARDGQGDEGNTAPKCRDPRDDVFLRQQKHTKLLGSTTDFQALEFPVRSRLNISNRIERSSREVLNASGTEESMTKSYTAAAANCQGRCRPSPKLWSPSQDGRMGSGVRDACGRGLSFKM